MSIKLHSNPDILDNEPTDKDIETLLKSTAEVAVQEIFGVNKFIPFRDLVCGQFKKL